MISIFQTIYLTSSIFTKVFKEFKQYLRKLIWMKEFDPYKTNKKSSKAYIYSTLFYFYFSLSSYGFNASSSF